MRPIDADAFKKYIDAQEGRPFIGCTVGEAMKILIDEQPTVQPEKAQLSKEGTTPAIPLTWIWKYIKWLQSLGNVLADQAGAHILAMVHKWGDEQNETD